MLARKMFDDAAVAFDRAIALNPNLAPAYTLKAINEVFSGRSAEAFALVDKAMRLSPQDPNFPNWLFIKCHAHSHLGQHDAAIAMLQVRELTADEDAEWAVRLRYAYADALLQAGREADARRWFVVAAKLDHDGETDAQARVDELDGLLIDFDETEPEVEVDDPSLDGEGAPR